MSRNIWVDGDVAYISLPRGLVAIIDADDAEYASQFWWSVESRPRSNYVVRKIEGGKKVRLHREVMNAPSGVLVDHINGDTLDCRKANLRFASCSQNSTNRRPLKPFKGATLHRTGRWQAQIMTKGRYVYLGLHDTEEAAHQAYAAASAKLHGEFGRTQ